MCGRSRFFNSVVALLALIIVLIQSACKKDDQQGSIMIAFGHKNGATALIKDSMIYTNAAGNEYEVNELQYFISDLTLWKAGQSYQPFSDANIHYVDIDLPATLEWKPDKKVPAGSYDSLTFIFGLDEEVNLSGLFVNPPERDMFWPDVMGGGYHYMKMNGKWKSDDGADKPFNLHLGIGMVSNGNGDDVFVHNYFKVTLPLIDCYVSTDDFQQKFLIDMDINSWFETPYLWDWDLTGGQIMQSQDAMSEAALNGKDAFKVAFVKSLTR